MKGVQEWISAVSGHGLPVANDEQAVAQGQHEACRPPIVSVAVAPGRNSPHAVA